MVDVLLESYFHTLVEAGHLDEDDWGLEVCVSGGLEHTSAWCRASTGSSATVVVGNLTRPCAQCSGLEPTFSTANPDTLAAVAVLVKVESALRRTPTRTTPGVLSARRTHLRSLATDLAGVTAFGRTRSWLDDATERLSSELELLDAAVLEARSQVLLWAATQAVADAPTFAALPEALRAALLDAVALRAENSPEAAASATANWGPRTRSAFADTALPLATRVRTGLLTRAWRDLLRATSPQEEEAATRSAARATADLVGAGTLADELAAATLATLTAERDALLEDPRQYLVARPAVVGDTSVTSVLDGFSPDPVVLVPAAVGAWAGSLSKRVGVDVVEVPREGLSASVLEVVNAVFDPAGELTLAQALEAALAL